MLSKQELKRIGNECVDVTVGVWKTVGVCRANF